MPDDVEQPISERARKIINSALHTSDPPEMPRDRPLTPVETAMYVQDYIRILEEGTIVLERRAVEYALAERDYRVKKARAILLSTHKIGAVKTADGDYQARDEMEARNAAEALSKAMTDTQIVRGKILDSLRTLEVSAREDAHGR